MEPIDIGLGESFRLARETMGLSRREVAEELKLAWKTVEDLEDENFESLPSFVYVRGYVKSYCKLVELDPETMSSKLSDVYMTKVSDTIAVEQNVSRRSTPRFASIGMSHVLLGLGFLIVVILMWSVDFDAKSKRAAGTGESLDNVPETVSKSDEPALVEEIKPIEVDDQSSAKAGATEEVSGDNDGQGGGAVVYSEEIQEPVSRGVEEDTFDSVKLILSERPENQFIDIGEVGNDTLVIDFNDDCWYEIEDGQENLLTSDLGRSGEIMRFRGRAPFKIKLGYAPGVSIRFNGGDVELAPYTRNNIAVFSIGRRENRDE